uniref:Uncharacterized protein n=1 Tax=Klebsiella pneumoniae TaxID=573 RepID=A0A2P1BPX8_KLEPN|nr:hypothetical protein [Klebsiella pneumoniae]
MLVSAPANGLKRVIRVPGKEQAPAATTERAGAKRRCPQSAGSFIAGTVKAARPGRSQQALPLTFQTSDTSRQARNRFAGSAELPRLFAVSGVWLDDWPALLVRSRRSSVVMPFLTFGRSTVASNCG